MTGLIKSVNVCLLVGEQWKEVKPGSSRFLKEGSRVCCFWSQQYRALYSGEETPIKSMLTASLCTFLQEFSFVLLKI